jgi:hypothetical protein
MVVVAACEAIGRPARGQRGAVFKCADRTLLELAGAPPEADYLFAHARVGQPGAPSRRRLRVGLVMRSVGGVVTHGWSVRGADLRDEFVQLEAIARGERSLESMKPDGVFHEAVRYLQAVGVQTLQIELPRQRSRREGLILNADIVLTRAGMLSAPPSARPSEQKPSA